jgi:hypothetical protein
VSDDIEFQSDELETARMSVAEWESHVKRFTIAMRKCTFPFRFALCAYMHALH